MITVKLTFDSEAEVIRAVKSIDYARGKLDIHTNPRDGFADARLGEIANAIERASRKPSRCSIDDDEGEDH